MRPLIHDRLAGKTIQAVLTNGHELIMQCTTGEEVVIGWTTDGPIFLRQDVKLVLPDARTSGLGNDVLVSTKPVTRINLDDLFRGY